MPNTTTAPAPFLVAEEIRYASRDYVAMAAGTESLQAGTLLAVTEAVTWTAYDPAAGQTGHCRSLRSGRGSGSGLCCAGSLRYH